MKLKLITIGMIMLFIAVLVSGAAWSQDVTSPDFINTLGVGARAIGMGSAFTAIADDPSATFWNPSRLGELRNVAAMLEYREVLKTTDQRGDAFDLSESAGFDEFWTENSIGEPGTSVQPLQIGFAGVTQALGDFRPGIGPTNGTIGLSWTLGGYFNYHLRTYNTATDVQEVTQQDLLVRNEFINFGWGKNLLVPRSGKLSPPNAESAPVPLDKFGIGVGYFRVTQKQSFRFASQTNVDDPLTPFPEQGPLIDSQPLNASGKGDGYIIGLAFSPWGVSTPDVENGRWKAEPFPAGPRWRLGATYRSKAEVDGLTAGENNLGESFGMEIPSRLAFGVAYEYTESEAQVGSQMRAPRQLTVSGEIQVYSAANDSSQIDHRESITNYGIGIEYIPPLPWLPIPGLRKWTEDGTKPAYLEPIRLGYRTNEAGNITGLFEDDNVISFGTGIYYGAFAGAARGNYDFSLEMAAEYLTEAEETLFTVSGNYRF